MPRTIWLASYPKSGNTWFRMLVANLSAGDGKPVDINSPPGLAAAASARDPFDYRLLIDSGLLTHDEIDCLRPRLYEELARDGDDHQYDMREEEEAPEVRFVLVHDAYTVTPKGEPVLGGRHAASGAILIVRDPRDVAPSFASYSRCSIDEAIAFMNDRNGQAHGRPGRLHGVLRQRHRGWSGHAESWLGQTDIPLCIIRYEGMKSDTIGTFRRALDFACYPASDEDIRRAVRFADFSELRRQEREKGFAGLPLSHLGGRFFRRGEVGAWRDELSAKQVARIEAAHGAMMRRFGYELAGAPSAALAR